MATRCGEDLAMTKMLSTFFLSEFTREEGGQGSDSSVLHTIVSGQWRMEVASAASAWLVVITTTLLRVNCFR